MTQNNETASVVTVEEAKEAVKAYWAARDAAAQVVEEVTIGFKVKESDGSQVLHMDGYSVAAVDGGYDALRAANIAKANDDTESAKAALGIVEACQDRAKVAAKALIADAGKRATECMRPGGSGAERERMRLCLKSALRAARVGYGKRK